MNIFSNFIPNSNKTVNPSDPPWHSKILHMPTEFMKGHTGPINKMDTLNVRKTEFKVLKKNTQG